MDEMTEPEDIVFEEQNEDDTEVYYTIINEDGENYHLESVDHPLLNDNVVYLSFNDDEEEKEQDVNIEEDDTNPELRYFQEVTIGDDDNNDTETFTSSNTETNEISIEDTNELFVNESSILNKTTDSDSESKDLTTIKIQDGVQFDETKYKQVQLQDGSFALIGNDLYNSIVNQAQNSPAKSKPEVAVKTYSCPNEDCDKTFRSMNYLKAHIRKHSGTKPYTCEVCKRSFTTSYSLKAHLRIHTGEKPYQCQTCSKRFKTSGDLSKHLRIHTGEKPFECPIEGCGRFFTTSNIRKVHIRSHTGERPYACPEPGCGKKFASATNHKNHIRIHSGEKPYVCQYHGCERRFTEYSSLYKHQTVHDSSKFFRCTYCNRSFRHLATLTGHKRTQHDIVTTENGTELMIKMVNEDDSADSSSNIYGVTILG